jgi:hypothetical protein
MSRAANCWASGAVLTRFRTFRTELPTMATQLDLDPLHITYVDFELILAGWLESRPVLRT